ncbi:RNA-binding domain-containing protein [Cylindrobasidium torrendii FP15055 ss-10]|uniref:RNA-binding domain-containing protein n=1 Tax=Cylindrobasidium torrendii FP15055 ss-10 TaxID=1314674 RepID=A0A0D7BJQ7_9AGAR|nr:RNA-binding domain-containing protein [Cylindrobasidium torrendii FP15055 ss-10]
MSNRNPASSSNTSSASSDNWRRTSGARGGGGGGGASKSPAFTSNRQQRAPISRVRPSTAPSSSHGAAPAPQTADTDGQDGDDAEVLKAVSEGRRLYVGNLPYMAKTRDIERLFQSESFTIQRIDISIDPFTGRNLSYCFVDMPTPAEAQRAIATLNQRDFLGRPLKVNLGIAKRRHDPTRPSKQPLAFEGWREPEERAAEHWKGVAEQGRRLYISGLPSMNYRTANERLTELFHDYKVEAVSKPLSPETHRPNSHPNHFYAFVDFVDPDAAGRAAAEFDGARAFGGTIRVSRARNNSRKVDERARWDEDVDMDHS